MKRTTVLRHIYRQFIVSRGRVWKTAIAAGVAWKIASLTGTTRPYFATLAAILCMQVTVEESVTKGYQRVLGIVGGIIVAEVTARYLGIHAWSIAVLVFIGTFLATLLRLGQQAIPQVGVSAMLVLTLGVGHGTQSYALDRILETILGVIVAVIINMMVLPPDFTENAKDALIHSAEELAMRYTAVAEWLSSGADVQGGEDLQDPTRGYLHRVHEAVESVERAIKALKYSPLVRRKEEYLRHYERELIHLRQGYAHVTGMMRTLIEWKKTGTLEARDCHVWSERFQDMSEVILQWRDYLHWGSVNQLIKPTSDLMDVLRDTPKQAFQTALINDARQLMLDFTDPAD